MIPRLRGCESEGGLEPQTLPPAPSPTACSNPHGPGSKGLCSYSTGHVVGGVPEGASQSWAHGGAGQRAQDQDRAEVDRVSQGTDWGKEWPMERMGAAHVESLSTCQSLVQLHPRLVLQKRTPGAGVGPLPGSSRAGMRPSVRQRTADKVSSAALLAFSRDLSWRRRKWRETGSGASGRNHHHPPALQGLQGHGTPSSLPPVGPHSAPG